MRVQTTLAFAPVRRASEGDGALHSAAIEPAPSLSRKRDSDSLLTAPASKRFAVPRRTAGSSAEAPVASCSEGERTEPSTPKLETEPVKPSGNLSSFLLWDTSCLQHHGIDSRRRKVHGRLFGFGAADDGSKLLLTGQSSHAVAAESIWQSGVRMLSSFGGPNRSQGAPPVMSINSDGTLAVVFQQGGRSMLQMPRENLYDRTAVPNFLYITCSNQIQDVSWSARSPSKIAVCSSTTSDIEVWNTSQARREAVLSGQTQIASGSVGFLAVQTIKDSPHMLAAGGYARTVQLWDARASTQASMSLPLMRDDVVTSLLCSPDAHRIIAGTSSGMLISWDTRKIAPSNVHVFGSRGPTQAQPSRVEHLPALAADWPTVLPYSAQLRLCTGVLASVGELQSAPPQPLSGSLAAVAAANAVRTGGVGVNAASSGVAAFRLGLSRSATLATKALGSKVNHLIADPTDPRRVAFSLSCGSAGVIHSDNCIVSHVFNPYTYQPRLRPLDMRTAPCNPCDISWSSDGSLLYRMLPQRHLRHLPEDDDILLPSCAKTQMHARPRAGSRSHGGGTWEDFTGPDDDMPVRRLMCALDATSQSALRCFGSNSEGSRSARKSNEAAPFCMEYRVQLPGAEGEDVLHMHGGDASREGDEVAEDSARVDSGAARCTGSQLRARFANLGASENGGDAGGLGERHDHQGRLASMPGGLESGVAFSMAGAEEGCTLLYDSFESMLLMCAPTALKGMPV